MTELTIKDLNSKIGKLTINNNYKFWVSGFKYEGMLIKELEHHYFILDRVEGKMLIPKAIACVVLK